MTTSHISAQLPPLKVSLDGEWRFKVDSAKVGLAEAWFADTTDRSAWRPVEIARYWEGYPDMASYDGWGWFARTFFLETSEPMSIHFAGVDDDATVWVNGVDIGSHTGYSEPFALDLKGSLRPGQNLIVVLVKDYGGGGGIYKPVTIIETRNLDELLKGKYFGLPALKSVEWVRDAVIYEVYLRSFSREGTFAGLEKRLPELKELGVTVLWLMPIHPVGVKNRKGTLGSPYSVRDYYAINPEFGTMVDFKRLLNAVHKNGMKLIIDLVANHTSWDSKLITEHPEWFTKDAKGNIIAPNVDWTDVADLNYSQPGLRRYMIDMMRWWVKDIGIDGFRCDVAELVPTDFWEEARKNLNLIKPVMMLAEGSLPEHHLKAFDLSYSWNIYDALDVLMQGKRPATLLDEIFKNERLQFPTGSLRMRFNTNHDKNASDAPAVVRLGEDGLKLSAVLVNTIPGVPLLYNGEEVANDQKLSLFQKVPIDWRRSHEMGELYRTLFALRRDHKALSRGEMIRVPSSNAQDIYAFFRSAGSDKILAVLNFSSEVREDSLQIPLARLFPGQKVVMMNELFSKKKVRVESGAEKLDVNLEPHGCRIFVTAKP
jgi:glycosidase